MSRNARIAVLLAFLTVLAGTAFFVAYNQPGFTGSRGANPDSYTLDIQKMHGIDRHTLILNADDVLQIHFETGKGSLHMEITAPDETVLYSGNGREASEFTIHVPQSGAYSVTVEARHATGNIRVQQKNALDFGASLHGEA